MRLIVATDGGEEIAGISCYESFDRDYEKGSEDLLQCLLDIDNQLVRAARIIENAEKAVGPLSEGGRVDLLLDHDESYRDSDQARGIVRGVEALAELEKKTHSAREAALMRAGAGVLAETMRTGVGADLPEILWKAININLREALKAYQANPPKRTPVAGVYAEDPAASEETGDDSPKDRPRDDDCPACRR